MEHVFEVVLLLLSWQPDSSTLLLPPPDENRAPSQLCNTNWVAPQTFDLGPLRENWKPLRKTKGIIKAITIFILNCVCERECIWRREIREQNIKILHLMIANICLYLIRCIISYYWSLLLFLALGILFCQIIMLIKDCVAFVLEMEGL